MTTLREAYDYGVSVGRAQSHSVDHLWNSWLEQREQVPGQGYLDAIPVEGFEVHADGRVVDRRPEPITQEELDHPAVVVDTADISVVWGNPEPVTDAAVAEGRAALREMREYLERPACQRAVDAELERAEWIGRQDPSRRWV